ncbi:rod shape-determining protein MreC [Pedosphaera parvula]|uniref:Cell shape-determining protein MreC n=1 Tax=Pedosphaera parvula (strain Ellin514) TaxID=320771 RepID=B9XG14_PEDPL|nr:rod shape-determining protein MreC [Pedosphaera parvula]EEF61176.1 rod shape-determining protein MreC [Pedosphaera parvula Ellin514]
MLKRPHYIALGLVGLLTLIVLNLPSHSVNQIKIGIGSLFLPMFGLAKSSHQIVDQATTAILPRGELIRQNEQLRSTNQQLQFRAMQSDAVMRENDQLRQLLGLQKQARWKLKLANLILRDPANWWQTVEIDVGTRDGIKPDMPVLTPTGSLVGRIVNVKLTHSQVALIGNPNCRVAAMIDKTGETGVISDVASVLDHSLVTLSYLSNNTNLKPGQGVITSGMGGFFPKGIPIGQIAEDSKTVEFGLYTEARVKLSANLSTLEEVFVLIP